MANRDFSTADAPGLSHGVSGASGGAVLSVNGSGPTLDGWLKKDASGIIRRRLSDFIRRQTEETAQVVRGFITPKHTGEYRRGDPGPGFTRANIEAHYYGKNRPEGSLYGKVRVQPGLVRGPGSSRYPARRREYIAAAVLNSGRYGGQKVTRVRVTTSGARKRQSWAKGERRQRGLLFWNRAYRQQRPKFDAFRAEVLVRGIE